MGVMSKGGNMEDSVERVIALLEQIKTIPQAMVVIAGSRGSGKTRVAKLLAEKGLGIYLSLSLALSRHRMIVDSDHDVGWPSDFIASLVSLVSLDTTLILDNIEAVFQPELQLHALSWFLQIAREIPLVVVWPGPVLDGEFVFSMPNRPDYFRQREQSVIVVNIGA